MTFSFHPEAKDEFNEAAVALLTDNQESPYIVNPLIDITSRLRRAVKRRLQPSCWHVCSSSCAPSTACEAAPMPEGGQSPVPHEL